MKTNVQQESEDSKPYRLFNDYSPEEDFRSQIGEADLVQFVRLYHQALDLTQNELGAKSIDYQNRNSKPNRMNENMKGLLFEEFPDNMRQTSAGSFCYSHSGYNIHFKKLNENLMPCYVRTKNSQLLFNSNRDVFVGYYVSKDWSKIKKVCAMSISNSTKVWIFDINDDGNNIIRTSPVNNDPEIVPDLVQPKKSVNKKQV